MTAVVLRGDARRLPLPDACVDLIVTSPPYFGLRSYTDNVKCYECIQMEYNGRDPRQAWPDYGAHVREVHLRHYDGQIGSEASPREWLAALVECTREWVRVLKPSGSLFVNLGDKFVGGIPGGHVGGNIQASKYHDHEGQFRRPTTGHGLPAKSLMGLPWRYALACTDELGLILRRDIIWSKPNSLPESVVDRCRSSHEYLFHLVRQPRYYAAVDEIREPHAPRSWEPTKHGHNPMGGRNASLPRTSTGAYTGPNPLGALPGSVWSIPSQPLTVPAHLGVDHFAAFPMELPRRCVLGWSPPGVCCGCGEGRRPVSTAEYVEVRGDSGRPSLTRGVAGARKGTAPVFNHWEGVPHRSRLNTITGYACACTPYTDHPGTGGKLIRETYTVPPGQPPRPSDNGRHQAGTYERVGPWREYHFDGWAPPPTRPALVLDPFGGTGTTALVAAAYGRIGIGVDLSGDYCRLARWRTADPGERARALLVPKPPPVPDGQGSLFDDWEAV